ncbi:unnamed protein product, partial [Ixodes hexagonus]
YFSYLYSHEARFADVETALHTKRAAQKYLELNLVGLCTEFVRKSIKPDTLCFVLDVLMVMHEPMSEYNDIINQTLKTKTGQVLDSKTFIAASQRAIFEVLRREKEISEYELLRSIYAWAVAKCSAATDSSPSNRVESTMKPFLPAIKLLSLTPEEFIEGPAAWKVFTVDESYRILGNIIKRGSMPLPEFCKP